MQGVVSAEHSPNRPEIDMTSRLPPDILCSLYRNGITSKLRPAVWMHASQGFHYKRHSDTDVYATHIRKADDPKCEELMKSIEQDLRRFMPENKPSQNPLYKNPERGHADQSKSALLINWKSASEGKVKRILLALALHIPEIGYTQAFMPMVYFAQRHVELDENDLFWVFVGLFRSQEIIRMYYCEGFPGLKIDQEILGKLVSRYFPDVTSHLQELDVDLMRLTYSWFLSLLVKHVSKNVSLMIWDSIFLRGSFAIFECILHCFSKVATKISKCRSNSDVKEILVEELQSLNYRDLNEAACTYQTVRVFINEKREAYVEEYHNSGSLSSISPKKKTFTEKMMDQNTNLSGKARKKREKGINKMSADLQKLNKRVFKSQNALTKLLQKKKNLEAALHEAMVNDEILKSLE